MNKDYLESLERLAMPDELHIKECKKLGIGLTEDFDLVEQALLELTSIKETKPSKALECLDRIDNTLCLNNIKGKLEFGIDTEEHSDCDSVIGMTEDLETIKQALLKAQEPKQYLKWEDLEFKKEEQTMKVLLNGERYILKYANEWFCGWCNKVQITNGTYILCTLGNGMKQFLNDLHLERVEE